MEIIFHSHANKTHFHKKGCAPSLILKVRVFGTRKWHIWRKNLNREEGGSETYTLQLFDYGSGFNWMRADFSVSCSRRSVGRELNRRR